MLPIGILGHLQEYTCYQASCMIYKLLDGLGAIPHTCQKSASALIL